MRFLVTDESGRLARWLRLLGYDAASMPAADLPALYERAVNEDRVIITRNRRVRPGELLRVVQLESMELEEQLRQAIRELDLQADTVKRFSRCDRCNVPVEPIERLVVEARVPPYVYETQEKFVTCPSCARIYWAATHWSKAQALFDRVARE